MALNIQKLLDRVTLGEGPHWSAREQALYFVSFFEHTIHKYVPATGLHTKTKLESPVNHIIPVEGTTDQFVVNDKLQLLVIRWDGQENSTVEVVKRLGGLDADNENHTTINDAKADPRGRLYTGTIGNGPGGIPSFDSIPMNQAALYKVDGGKIEKLANDIRLSNGLAFDLKEKALYYVDTLEYNIRRYDYDVETGNISNKTYIFDFKKNNLEGYPDGMTIDTDGNLWVAVFEGYAVLKIDPRTGTLLQKIDIPVRQVTSVTFGGPDLDILYVTTAAMVRREGYELQPLSGCLFSVTGLGVTGTPNLEVKL